MTQRFGEDTEKGFKEGVAIEAVQSLRASVTKFGLSQKRPWVHRFHRFAQIKGTITGLFGEGRFASTGVRGGGAHRRNLRHLRRLRFQLLILKSEG